MKNCLITLCFSIIFLTGFPQPASFDTTNIPEAVRKNASVVKRYEKIVFEVSDIDRATLDVQQIYTILNDDGKNMLLFNQYSSKLISLTEAEIRVYDANGKQVNRYRKKDMRTVATGEGLIEDGYVTYFDVPASSYPITVVYTYQQRYSGTLFYPSYRIHNSGEGVESSVFIAKVPTQLDLRFQEKNISIKPEITETEKFKIYQWSVKDISPVKYEEGASDAKYPLVTLAPNKFYLYGYEGELTTWKSFGQWIKGLYKGLDVLPADRQLFFKELVKDASTDEEKAKIIYNYLQKNFRYVSIQLGIGGFKPFSADFTDKKKYGDCKALSNFMKAALNAVGVKSYVAIINSGYNGEPVDPAFPSNSRFNHAILCIPQQKDSIWLECTSSTSEFGVLGSSTENRNALLVTEEGGALVSTPKSMSSANKFNSASTFVLEEDGSGQSLTSITTTGFYKEMMDYVIKEKDDEKKEFLVRYLGYKQPDEFRMNEREQGKNYVVSLQMSFSKIPEMKTGNKMFLTPRMYKVWINPLPKSENRRLDYFFQNPFEKTDTTIYKLPVGFKPEAMPQSKELKSDFASYSSKFWYDENEKAIYSVVKLTLKQNRIPASKYQGIKSFFDDVLMDHSQRIVIKKE